MNERQQSRKRSAATGLFFDFGNDLATAPYLLYHSTCPAVKYDGEVNDGDWPIEAIVPAHGEYLAYGTGSIVGAE